MSALFLELDRPVLFLSFPFESKKLLVSFDAVVGLELLATTLTEKHMATVLPNYVLVRRLQRLKSFVPCITGVNFLSLACFVPQH